MIYTWSDVSEIMANSSCGATTVVKKTDPPEAFSTIKKLAKFKTGSGLLLLFGLLATRLFLVAGFLGSVLSGLRHQAEDLRFRFRSVYRIMEASIEHLNLHVATEFFGWKKFSKTSSPGGTAKTGGTE